MELAKDLNDVYKNLQDLWENIYPIMIFHVLFILLFTLITGLKLFSTSQIEKIYHSEKFSGVKRFIISSGLKEKFTWTTLVLALILYLVVFSGLFKIFSSLNIPLVKIKPSFNNFYKDTRPINKLTEIAIYSPIEKPSIGDIEITKGVILEAFQSMNQMEYQEKVGFWETEISKDRTIYDLLILSLTFGIVIILKSKIEKNKVGTYLRCALFVLLNLMLLINLRWLVEQDVEAVFVAKTNIASRYVSTNEYTPTKSHIPTRDIYFAGSYQTDKNKILLAKEFIKPILVKQLNALKTENNLWISDWSIVSNFFGNRKLYELKD
jgi:hypothetical protein